MSTEWEHDVVDLGPNPRPDLTRQLLARRAGDGWELVSVDGGQAYMRRPVTGEGHQDARPVVEQAAVLTGDSPNEGEWKPGPKRKRLIEFVNSDRQLTPEQIVARDRESAAKAELFKASARTIFWLVIVLFVSVPILIALISAGR